MTRDEMINKLYHWICDEYVMVMSVRQDELNKLRNMSNYKLNKMYMNELIRRTNNVNIYG